MSKKPAECECCQYPTKKLEQFDRMNMEHRGEKRCLCGLCAGTFIGNMTDYPRLHDHSIVTLAQSMAYIGNAIIDAIGKSAKR